MSGYVFNKSLTQLQIKNFIEGEWSQIQELNLLFSGYEPDEITVSLICKMRRLIPRTR